MSRPARVAGVLVASECQDGGGTGQVCTPGKYIADGISRDWVAGVIVGLGSPGIITGGGTVRIAG
jgi:hypothetical protein